MLLSPRYGSKEDKSRSLQPVIARCLVHSKVNGEETLIEVVVEPP